MTIVRIWFLQHIGQYSKAVVSNWFLLAVYLWVVELVAHNIVVLRVQACNITGLSFANSSPLISRIFVATHFLLLVT